MSRKAKNPQYGSCSDDALLNLKLSFYRVWISGLFYRTYEAEQSGMPADFMAAAAQFIEGKTYSLEKSKDLIDTKKQKALARDYLKDYNRWKEVYSI